MEQVGILLAVYNGEKYLREQIDSLLGQSYKNIKIFIIDDNSQDNSLSIIKQYKDIIFFRNKKNLGPSFSFEKLLDYVVKNESDIDYIMFCDQDDVWLANKVELTLKEMKTAEKKYFNLPLLVHSDLKVVDQKLEVIDHSFWNYQKFDPKVNSFNRLLLQNTVTGCTMMINRELAQMVLPFPKGIVIHDWWIALVASLFGKIVTIYKPLVLYRQHSSNVIGAKKFSGSLYKMLNNFFERKKKGVNIYKQNIKQGEVLYKRYKILLTPYQREVLRNFIILHKLPLWKRHYILIKYKLYKQGFLRNLGLFLEI